MELRADEVMDRAAALLNDPQKTDYTYIVQLPYLNMAIDELLEHLEESNAPPTNIATSIPIYVPAGWRAIPPMDDLIEIQEIGEREHGSTNAYTPMQRLEFLNDAPPSNSLLFFAFENQIIRFNKANTDRDLQLKYIRRAVPLAIDEKSPVSTVKARSFLSYKTAALCAMFIGENVERATILTGEAEAAMERIEAIHNKGKQQIVTRHKPFRASYKARGRF